MSEGLIAPGLPDPGRIRMVALDVDGTIVNHDGALSDRVRDAIQAVANSGRHVVVATGRSPRAVTPILDRLGLTDGYAVSCNGALTMRIDPASCDGYEIADIVEFEPGPVLRVLREQLPNAVYAVEDRSGQFRLTAPFPEGELLGRFTFVSFEELSSSPVTRVVVRSPEHTTAHFVELMHRLGLSGVSYAVGWSAWLDIAPEGVSKAHGLQLVADALGVLPSEVMAVGDGRNDLEMFGWAGHSVAMGQATSEVRAAATSVCADVAADGLADVLDRLS
ncbi:MAG: HAD family hydrolase [Actinomycetota bacterium]